MTTFLTILLVTFTDGSTYERPYSSSRECSDAIARVEALANENDLPIEMVQCVPTGILTKSPVPMRRPEGGEG